MRRAHPYLPLLIGLAVAGLVGGPLALLGGPMSSPRGVTPWWSFAPAERSVEIDGGLA